MKVNTLSTTPQHRGMEIQGQVYLITSLTNYRLTKIPHYSLETRLEGSQNQCRYDGGKRNSCSL